MRSRTTLAALAIASLSSGAFAQSGGPYEIVAWTIDGGGISNATGGSFTLSGTVGQHDAGPTLTGGLFELSGGFWPAALAAANPCPADINNDGQLNFFDVAAYIALFNAGDPAADINNDGQLNFFDVAAYIALFNAGCP
ncbi:MAG: hypothetical protein JJU44_11400 [Planctomycetes bacterium]|nr:hypothetical protein [Planctomycetota bacterium]